MAGALAQALTATPLLACTSIRGKHATRLNTECLTEKAFMLFAPPPNRSVCNVDPYRRQALSVLRWHRSQVSRRWRRRLGGGVQRLLGRRAVDEKGRSQIRGRWPLEPESLNGAI